VTAAPVRTVAPHPVRATPRTAPRTAEPRTTTRAALPRTTRLPAAGRLPAVARFSSCKEARKAGVTPLRLGQPGYSKALDRDNDGIACD
jgi:hypothetical protein